MTPATIEYSNFNNQAINIAREDPRDNFIILSKLILFKYKPPVDKYNKDNCIIKFMQFEMKFTKYYKL